MCGWGTRTRMLLLGSSTCLRRRQPSCMRKKVPATSPQLPAVAAATWQWRRRRRSSAAAQHEASPERRADATAQGRTRRESWLVADDREARAHHRSRRDCGGTWFTGAALVPNATAGESSPPLLQRCASAVCPLTGGAPPHAYEATRVTRFRRLACGPCATQHSLFPPWIGLPFALWPGGREPQCVRLRG